MYIVQYYTVLKQAHKHFSLKKENQTQCGNSVNSRPIFNILSLEDFPVIGSKVIIEDAGRRRVATDGRTNTDRRTFPATAVGKTDAPETRPA